MKLVPPARWVAAVAAATVPWWGGVPASVAAPPDEGRYVVVLHAGAADPGAVAAEHARRHGAQVRHVYRHALHGYAATFRRNAASEAARDSRVAYVEPDGEMRASGTQSPVTWGLDRIDQRDRTPLSNSFTYTNTGAGVTAYIIDTGIRADHAEFGGRVTSGSAAYDGVAVPAAGGDCNGHGTHVAGTVGGASYGVAKAVTLVPVRVLDCTGAGTNSGVIAGVDWVTGNHVAGTPAVANMSLGGGASRAVDDAVRRSVADGISYAVAAGNGDLLGNAQDACTVSPARVAEAMTISATDRNDARASWANYGSCVDWFAPGVGVTSAWHTAATATNTISGTSMAAPHTAGVAALYLQSNPASGARQVRDALYVQNSTDKVTTTTTTLLLFTSGATANNHLLFTAY